MRRQLFSDIYLLFYVIVFGGIQSAVAKKSHTGGVTTLCTTPDYLPNNGTNRCNISDYFFLRNESSPDVKKLQKDFNFYVNNCSCSMKRCKITENKLKYTFALTKTCTGMSTLYSKNISTDCIGYKLSTKYTKKSEQLERIDKIYLFKNNKNGTLNINFDFQYGTSYVFQLTILGMNTYIELSGTYPSKCVFDLKCKGGLLLRSCDEIEEGIVMRKACEKHLGNFTNALLELKGHSCKNKSPPDQKNIIVVCAGVSILLLSLYFIQKKLWRRFNITELNPKGIIPTVMLLARPGCELLNKTVRDIAFILQLHGIKVKVSLLEQAEVDANGGIASYLQHNIDACDNVLILFTPSHNDNKLFSAQRPYEFALQMISGMMSNGFDHLKYVTLYIDAPKKCVEYVPKEFRTKKQHNYRVPQDLQSLIADLSGEKDLFSNIDKDVEIKTNFFIGRIKLHLNNYQANSHNSCINGYCQKGRRYPSVSNLSSFWTKTSAPSENTIINHYITDL